MAKYYVDDKELDTEKDIILCRADESGEWEAFADIVVIYVTRKRTFYRVLYKGSSINGIRIISEEDAKGYLNEHAQDVVNENYSKIFGKPKRG